MRGSYPVLSVSEDSLISAGTTSAAYPIGMEYVVVNTTANLIDKWRYVKAGADLVAYQPTLVLQRALVSGNEFVASTSTPGAYASAVSEVGVPMTTVTSSNYFWIKTGGRAIGLTTGGALALGQGLMAGTTLAMSSGFEISTTGDPYATNVSAIVSTATTAGNTNAPINLVGYRVTTC